MSEELMDSDKPKYIRKIRSFVKREGRLTPGQERILKESAYLIRDEDIDSVKDLNAVFGRDNTQRTLEIGFGNGESLVEMAKNNPDRDFLGLEVHKPGVGHLLLQVEEKGLTNLYVANYDAVELLKNQCQTDSFNRVQIFFPDPWHKKKHHKRRIIQPEFLSLAASKMQSGGIIHLATDWEHYAVQMMEMLSEHKGFKNCYDGYAPHPNFRPKTKFEMRGERLGHGIWDILFTRN